VSIFDLKFEDLKRLKEVFANDFAGKPNVRDFIKEVRASVQKVKSAVTTRPEGEGGSDAFLEPEPASPQPQQAPGTPVPRSTPDAAT